MNAKISLVNRKGGTTALICATDDLDNPCVKLEVVERAAGSTNLVRMVPGDSLKIDGDRVLWTPRYGNVPEADRVAGVDFDIPLG